MSKVRSDALKGRSGRGDEDEPAIRIGELSRRCGIPAANLRAWERRYGVVEPARGESGYRLYSRSDEERMRTMASLIAEGLAPAEAARRARRIRDTQPPRGTGHDTDPELAEALLAALMALDGGAADAVLDRGIATLSVPAVVGEVVLPVLRAIGEGWACGETSVGQEHFATNHLRGRLLGLARGWDGGSGELALLACPGAELHDLGLMSFGLVLRSRGWRIAFLGADVPARSIVDCVRRAAPSAVVLFTRNAALLRPPEPELLEIAASSRLLLAGAGAETEICEALGAEPLTGDPLEAALRLSA